MIKSPLTILLHTSNEFEKPIKSVPPWLFTTGVSNPKNIAPLNFLGSNFSLNFFKLKYENNNINYISIHKNLLRLIKSPFFSKYYKLKPKNIYDIKKMILITKKYLNLNIKHYDN